MYFTDNVVIGMPADGEEGVDPTGALNNLLAGVSTYIVGMAITAGLAFRGGLAFGKAYIDDAVLHDDLAAVQAAHGPALVEAVKLEQRAIYPRVLVADSVVSELRRLKEEASSQLAFNLLSGLLVDEDGLAFLDHLGDETHFDPTMSIVDPSAGTQSMTVEQMLVEYRSFIVDGLAAGGRSVAKYRWLANYFNHVVRAKPFGLEIEEVAPPTFASVRLDSGGAQAVHAS